MARPNLTTRGAPPATPGIVVEPLFSAFATAAFFEFALFAVFELRYLLHAWRARRSAAADPWAAQRELSLLYAQFYGWLLGGILLTYQLQRCVRLPYSYFLLLCLVISDHGDSHHLWVTLPATAAETAGSTTKEGPRMVGARTSASHAGPDHSLMHPVSTLVRCGSHKGPNSSASL